MPVELPHDVWLHIALFLPDQTLDDLICLNRVFYALALDARYRTITLDRSQRALLRTLERISTPAVAPRVRTLVINAHALTIVQYDNTSWQDFGVTRAVRRFSMAWLRQKTAVLRVGARRRRAPITEPQQIGEAQISLEETTVAMVAALRHLSAVTTFSILAPWGGSTGAELEEALRALLSEAWASLGAHLTALTLQCTSGTLRSLLAGAPPPPHLRLEVLDVTFVYEYVDGSNTVDELLPLICGLRSTLRSLTLVFGPNQVPTPFFESLGYFPYLRTLNVTLSPDYFTSPRAASVKTFLNAHRAQLMGLTLALRPYPADTFALESAPLAYPALILEDHAFPNLVSLHVDLALVAATPESAVARFKDMVGAPAHLTLTGYALAHANVAAMLSALVKNSALTALCLPVHHLTPELVELLAAHVPRVQHITLTIGHVLSAEGTLDGGHWHVDDAVVHVDSFCQAMETREFPGWALKEFVIEWRCSCGSTYSPRLSAAVTGAAARGRICI